LLLSELRETEARSTTALTIIDSAVQLSNTETNDNLGEIADNWKFGA